METSSKKFPERRGLYVSEMEVQKDLLPWDMREVRKLQEEYQELNEKMDKESVLKKPVEINEAIKKEILEQILLTGEINPNKLKEGLSDFKIDESRLITEIEIITGNIVRQLEARAGAKLDDSEFPFNIGVAKFLQKTYQEIRDEREKIKVERSIGIEEEDLTSEEKEKEALELYKMELARRLLLGQIDPRSLLAATDLQKVFETVYDNLINEFGRDQRKLIRRAQKDIYQETKALLEKRAQMIAKNS